MRSLQDHFLIAMPAMADPHFNETVTYICKHDADGAFGVVINRPSDLSLAEMLGQLAIQLEDRSKAGQAVVYGGPWSRSAVSCCTAHRRPSTPR
jgi:putative transcriptional regulator